METVTFSYTNSYDGDTDTITINKSNEDALTTETVCDVFMDFMNAVGYSKERILEYFSE